MRLSNRRSGEIIVCFASNFGEMIFIFYFKIAYRKGMSSEAPDLYSLTPGITLVWQAKSGQRLAAKFAG